MAIIERKLSEKILIELLKNFSSENTITSLASYINVSRVGIWKALKKLETDDLIIVEKIGDGKTSTYRIKLNWKNSLTEKALSFYLTKEASEHKKWVWDFKELENHVEFSILFGSILSSPKAAIDIDITNIVPNKKAFLEIEKILRSKQVAHLQKIHDINFTPKEFKAELIKPNKAFISAIKNGVILFGQQKFVTFMRKIIR